jgi:lipocalin
MADDGPTTSTYLVGASPNPRPCFSGSYWIIQLGPIKGGKYQYSVVTDGDSRTLFILVSFPLSTQPGSSCALKGRCLLDQTRVISDDS